MRRRNILVAALFALALAPAAARAQDEANQVSGSQLRPELYVRQIKGTPGSETRLRVQIANRGNVASLPCTLTVDIFQSNAFNPKAMRESLDLPVPAIEPGRTAWVVTEQIETNFVRADARNNVTPVLPFRLTVDAKDDNPEFDERNNVVRYPVSRKAARKLIAYP
jgi:hypothetical protein